MKNLKDGIIVRSSKRKIIKESIYDRMNHYNVPGVSITAINNFKIEWSNCFGIIDTVTKSEVTNETLFQAASISKTFTAVAILKLVQDGLLNLSDNINDKLKTFQIQSDSKITIRQLLSHTAGISVRGFDGYKVTEEAPTLEQVLKGAIPANSQEVKSILPSGQEFKYSGGGYSVLQQLLEDHYQKTFHEIISEIIFKPLKMENSYFIQPLPTHLSNISSGHKICGNRIEGKNNIYPELAAAGLWIIPEDIAKFIIELQLSIIGKSNKILNQEITKIMFTPVIDNAIEKKWLMGLGIFLENKKSETYFHHGGGNCGYKCHMIGNLKEGYGAVVMTNSENGVKLLNEIIDTIAHDYEWSNFLPLKYHKSSQVDQLELF